MVHNIRLWKIANHNTLQEISPSRLDLETRLEAWLEADISLVDAGLLVIGRQVETDFGGFIDLLCIDVSGDLTILELKRDKTPREVVAQALDYAAWVVDLSHDRIVEIANAYLGARGPLERAYQERFGGDVPEAINQSHKILILASSIDPSSERIIQYLSTAHGVNINAVTFQYFKDQAGQELLARVFLIEPERVEYKALTKGGSKRKRVLTYEELQAAAEERSVGELYQQLIALFRPHKDAHNRFFHWVYC